MDTQRILGHLVDHGDDRSGNPPLFEAYELRTFRGYRRPTNSQTAVEVIVEVSDAGPYGHAGRYSISVYDTSRNLLMATNAAYSLDEALTLIRWAQVDAELARLRH